MEMTSNCDVTNSTHQMQMTTIWPSKKNPIIFEILCVRHCALESDAEIEGKGSVTPKFPLSSNNRKAYSLQHLHGICRASLSMVNHRKRYQKYTWPTNWWI